MLRDLLRPADTQHPDQYDAMRHYLQAYLQAVKNAGITNNVIFAVLKNGKVFVYDLLDHDIDPSSPTVQQRLEIDKLMTADSELDNANKKTPLPSKPLQFSHFYIVPPQEDELIRLLNEHGAEWEYIDKNEVGDECKES